MLRKLTYTLIAVGLLVALGSTSATGRVRIRCKVPPANLPPAQKSLYCENPRLHLPLNVRCQRPGGSFKIPVISADANAGILEIKITVRSTPRTVLDKHYSNSPVHVVLRGVTISTVGLGRGVHTVTVTVIDTRGKRAVQVGHFAVCPPPPPITTG
jgi:hypothetical protein